MLGRSVSTLFILHRTNIPAEYVKLSSSWVEYQRQGKYPKPSDEQIVKLLYKEADNIIKWATNHDLKLEIKQQYDYKLDTHDIVLYTRVTDPHKRLLLELSKPDPIKNG